MSDLIASEEMSEELVDLVESEMEECAIAAIQDSTFRVTTKDGREWEVRVDQVELGVFHWTAMQWGVAS